MNILKCDPFRPASFVIASAVHVLKAGGIVAHPTDTCYGLAVDIYNERAVEALYKAKGMERDKPVSVLVRSLDEAREYGVFSETAIRIAREFWPGALTLVVPRTSAVPIFLNPNISTIGLRVISEPVSVALLNAFDGPLTTTSANHHKVAAPYSVSEISMVPDLVLDAGELKAREKPSTIIQVEGDEAVVLRQGGIFLEL